MDFSCKSRASWSLLWYDKEMHIMHIRLIYKDHCYISLCSQVHSSPFCNLNFSSSLTKLLQLNLSYGRLQKEGLEGGRGNWISLFLFLCFWECFSTFQQGLPLFWGFCVLLTSPLPAWCGSGFLVWVASPPLLAFNQCFHHPGNQFLILNFLYWKTQKGFHFPYWVLSEMCEVIPHCALDFAF